MGDAAQLGKRVGLYRSAAQRSHRDLGGVVNFALVEHIEESQALTLDESLGVSQLRSEDAATPVSVPPPASLTPIITVDGLAVVESPAVMVNDPVPGDTATTEPPPDPPVTVIEPFTVVTLTGWLAESSTSASATVNG